MNIPYAAATGVVSVERLIPYMTEKMRARCGSLPFAPKSAIIAAFPYHTGNIEGNIARFARVTDYHEVLYAYLRDAVQDKKGFMAVKNGWPLPLVPAARLAGVGFTGRHGLQIVPPYGSYVALGAILCEESLDETRSECNAHGMCGACGACERACPTGAMRFEGDRRVLNRELCIAGITQAKEPEKLNLLEKSSYIWGCDICQEVCPHNADAALTAIPAFLNSVIPSFGAHELPGRHYSGRESLLLRNMKVIAAAKSAADATAMPSTSQTFSITPV